LSSRLEEGVVEDGNRSSVGSSGILGVSSVFGVSRTVLRASGDAGQEGEGKDDLGQHRILCDSRVDVGE
jgi:hypothetical protein